MDLAWSFTVLPMLIALFPLLIGIAITSYGVVVLRRNARLRAVGVPVTAMVVDNQIISGTDGQVGFSPVITFRTREGRDIKTSGSGQSHRSYIIGTTIDVQYDPERPEKVIVPGQSAGPWVAIVFGLIFVAFAVVIAAVFGGIGAIFGMLFGGYADDVNVPFPN